MILPSKHMRETALRQISHGTEQEIVNSFMLLEKSNE
jgi:hypothetical protein